MSLTDARRMYVLLRDAGESGVHSHELRHKGVSGNPSQRAKDIASHGVGVWTARENVGRRPGARYWLVEHAPDWAVPVRPNRDVEVGGEPGGVSPHRGPGADEHAADLSITPAPDPLEPVAIFRDFTDPDGRWMEVPVSELGLPEAA